MSSSQKIFHISHVEPSLTDADYSIIKKHVTLMAYDKPSFDRMNTLCILLSREYGFNYVRVTLDEYTLVYHSSRIHVMSNAANDQRLSLMSFSPHQEGEFLGGPLRILSHLVMLTRCRLESLSPREYKHSMRAIASVMDIDELVRVQPLSFFGALVDRVVFLPMSMSTTPLVPYLYRGKWCGLYIPPGVASKAVLFYVNTTWHVPGPKPPPKDKGV